MLKNRKIYLKEHLIEVVFCRLNGLEIEEKEDLQEVLLKIQEEEDDNNCVFVYYKNIYVFYKFFFINKIIFKYFKILFFIYIQFQKNILNMN